MKNSSVTLSLVLGAAALALTACSSNPFATAPLTASPTTPVQGQPLPPPVQAVPQPTVAAPSIEEIPATRQTVQQVAAYGPARVDDMSGGWTVTDTSGSCSLFMSTTAWTGGYRAVTRGCPSSTLQSVNAWDVVDGKIALKDANGTEIARLTRTGETSYSGAFGSGSAVSFSR